MVICDKCLYRIGALFLIIAISIIVYRSCTLNFLNGNQNIATGGIDSSFKLEMRLDNCGRLLQGEFGLSSHLVHNDGFALVIAWSALSSWRFRTHRALGGAHRSRNLWPPSLNIVDLAGPCTFENDQ